MSKPITAFVTSILAFILSRSIASFLAFSISFVYEATSPPNIDSIAAIVLPPIPLVLAVTQCITSTISIIS